MPPLQKDPETIRALFDAIADRYDLLNAVMSLGIHNFWLKTAVSHTGIKPGETVLDVCCGTGMITRELAKIVGPCGMVSGIDLSSNMLRIAQSKTNSRISGRIRFIQGDARQLPFADNTFHCAIVGYGIRNVPDPLKLLSEMQRVVKPGGRIVSLEMSHPRLPLIRKIYQLYLSYGIPGLGKWIAHNEAAYHYLCQSIIQFCDHNEITNIFHQLGLVKV
ncbi:MAG TPA: bifunctional demethylmenaquinone methyltransferase/2-methoxy-6-polyprenyl-1,4-benzoquinol methylase UbiE, partial [Bacillota bacterium]|nr:bifunctional demethylmenaquinone methyltransferase/2-methoxy-6-polyprenyl-1,4-benzoquinol methylase UbiE [Bacillota bacterium]